MKARSILATFRPHAVVGVGGYASFPMLSAAQAIGVPTLIQEQNSYAGKSNKMLARRAEAICVAYDQMDKFFPKEKLTLTGNPVRKEISTSNITNSAALALFGLKPDVSTILVVGGSQGAKSINEAIDGGLDALMQTGAQLIWQTGNSYYSRAAERAAKYGKAVFVSAFIKDMAAAYAAANVVVSRAGALAIAELCIAGKPVIFVPYPFAAEDHQTSNAMAIVNNKGALLVKDNDAAATLVPRIATLLADNVLQNTMAGNINKMAIKNADERIAYKIMSIAKGAS
jgi:UDP-N-acetylglucosamine--N-acetylmuramyl-(pentapeptide) pyrophosphoryl-undecaprenol N-acetylglucosamine transferase